MEFLELASGGGLSDYAVLLITIRYIWVKIQERWKSVDEKAEKKETDKAEADAKEASRLRLERIDARGEEVLQVLTELFDYASKPSGEGFAKLKEAVHLAYSNKELVTSMSKTLDTNGPVSKQLDKISEAIDKTYSQLIEVKAAVTRN